MGKHDKDNFEWKTPKIEPAVITYDPPKDDYYKARISALEKENLALREKVNNLEKEVGKLELIIDHDEKLRDGLDAEYKEYAWEQQHLIADLKEAIVQAALREVHEE